MHKTFRITGKKQADGAQTISLAGYERVVRKQVQIDVSATPGAGTMAVAVRTPGSDEYVTADTINMVSGTRVFLVDLYCDSIRLTPTSYDAAKTYDITVFCLQG